MISSVLDVRFHVFWSLHCNEWNQIVNTFGNQQQVLTFREFIQYIHAAKNYQELQLTLNYKKVEEHMQEEVYIQLYLERMEKGTSGLGITNTTRKLMNNIEI